MGKLDSQNFDMQIAQISQAYFIASGKGDWETAAHYLLIKNNTIRQDNRISDLKPFQPKNNSLREELLEKEGYKKWCIKYGPLVEAAVTRERDLLARSYGR
jgi:hypothetical protein